MSHARQQIREALVTALTGLVTTGSRVFVHRVKPLATGDLPALVVRVMDEAIEAISLDWPGTLNRSLRVELEGIASGADAADTIDTVLEEIEVALTTSLSAATLGGLLKTPLTPESVSVVFDDEGTPPVASLTATYAATYQSLATAPGAAI